MVAGWRLVERGLGVVARVGRHGEGRLGWQEVEFVVVAAVK